MYPLHRLATEGQRGQADCPRSQVLTTAYHTVHSKMIVLRLKLHCVRVAGPNLRVAV